MGNRTHIPKAIQEQVKEEFNYKCAICGHDNTQLHHIDGDPGNSDPMNLIPLCPNCHLGDQHNPTQPVDIGILKLFRKHKDPTILTPQFYPLFRRLKLLIDRTDTDRIDKNHLDELVDFVAVLNMGEFYSRRIYHYLRVTPDRRRGSVYTLPGMYTIHPEDIEKVVELVVELLRYQESWIPSGRGVSS